MPADDTEAGPSPKDLRTVTGAQTQDISRRATHVDGPARRPRPGPAEDDALLVRGRAIGRYLVVERLGSGGMGVVYRAFDPDLDRSVALKLVGVGPGTGSGDTLDVRERLLREAQAMARLSHPNVIAVFDVGLCDESGRSGGDLDDARLVYVAMELVDGSTLGQWLKAAPRSWREIVDVFVQAGRGVAAAHAAGLIHRDFKPDNVMLGRDGRVRVLDFGLARALGSEPAAGRERDVEDLRTTGRESLERSITAAGAVMGTPAYMSPEQHLGTATDGKSDQFSFCVALFEALYGQRPFPGDTFAALAFSVLHGQLEVPAERAGSVPAHVHAAVVRGLSTAAAERFPTMDDLLAALERDPSARRRRRLTSLGAAILLLGGGAAIGAAVSRDAPSETPPPVCTGAARELEAVWNDERRAAIADAFANTGLGYAAGTWTSAAAELDVKARAWVDAHTRACEATRVTGEQSEAAMDLRIACLGEQRDRMDALLSGLRRVDIEGVRRTIDAVHALPDPALCADPTRLSSDAPPSDPEVAAVVHEVDLALANVRAALALGRFAEASAAISPWVAVAQATGHAPLWARTRSLQAEAEEDAGDPKRARTILEDAMWAATEAGSDRFAADIARRLAFDVGYRLGEHEAGRRWLAHGRALERRLGGDEELEARLSGAEGAIDVSAGRYEDALVAHGRARAYWSGREDGKAELASVLLDIAAVDIQLGRVDEAIALGTEAIGIRRAVYGEDHPTLAAALRELGNAHGHAHDWDAALPLFRDALRIQTAARGEEHVAVATLHDDLGRVLRKKGDTDAAIEHHQRALQIWIARLGENHQDVGVSRLNIGYTLSAIGRREDAAKEFEAALHTFEASVGERHAYVVYAENARAAALVQLGRSAQARPGLERVLAMEGLEVDPTLLAETEFTLANALWEDPASSTADRARARRLAEKALAGYRTQAERWAPQIAQIEGWLKEHP